MRSSFTITFIFLLFCFGCNKSTAVVEDEIEYEAEHKLFLDNLLDLNTTLHSDTLEARITKQLVTGTEYYRISKVSLNNLGLSELPTSISYLDSLTTLDISNNQLTNLPESICILDVINGPNFIFNDNHLCDPKTLPNCMIAIINFTEQKCDYDYEEEDFQFIQEIIVANKIDTNGVYAENEIYDNVSWVISEKTNEYGKQVLMINKIEWDDKNISIIPETIGLLDSLTWLELENNHIDSIPGMIGNLKKLEYLQLYDNGLKYIHEGLGNLSNLRTLHLHNNALESLAFSFEKMTALKELWITNNSLVSLPQSLCTLISEELLPSSAFYYYGNNICTLENACSLSINEQDCE